MVPNPDYHPRVGRSARWLITLTVMYCSLVSACVKDTTFNPHAKPDRRIAHCARGGSYPVTLQAISRCSEGRGYRVFDDFGKAT